MSLFLNHPSKLCLRKPVFVRFSPLCSNEYFFAPPYSIVNPNPWGDDFGNLNLMIAGDQIHLTKKVPLELFKEMATIGSSYGWVTTLKDDNILCLQDDLNPAASSSDPKHIPLPPLVTLPHCQTQIITNVSLSSRYPDEDKDCLVAVKFLGPQISFCRPARSNSEWINIRIENPCFYSSRVIFSKERNMFCMPGSGGHLIASWGLGKHKNKPKIQKLRLQNIPELNKTKRDLMESCYTSEHLVESESTGEMFLVKWYRKNEAKPIEGMTTMMKTKAIMVFKLDEKGNAVYTDDIGDLCMYLSKSEPFCVPASYFTGIRSNRVIIFDVDEVGTVFLDSGFVATINSTFGAPYHFPPRFFNQLP